jgi:hypothetical protein
MTSPSAGPRHLTVFVSSPGDLAEERALLPQVLRDIERSPAWKGKFTFSALSWDDPHAPVPMDAHLTPQKAVDVGLGLPSQSDLIVVLLWQRMGTPMSEPRRSDGTSYLSGTEYEFEQALAAPDGPPVLLYRRLDEPPTPQPAAQRERVQAFFDRLGPQTAHTGYRSTRAFAERFGQDLQALLRRWDDSATDGPPLERQTFEVERWSRLNFRARSVALLGRESEWQAIEAFAAGDEPLRWWVVASEGGAGKSRIALELVLSLMRRRVAPHRRPWRAGFLPRAHGYTGWNAWRPDRPTLMVIDYAASRDEEIHHLLLAVTRQSARYEAPLRVLLLERDGSEQAVWFKKAIGTGSEAVALRQTMYSAALKLSPLGDAALVTLLRGQIAALANRAAQEGGPAGATPPSPDDAELVQRIAEVDPARRPLFALLVAEALAQGTLGRIWTRQELFADWLAREQERYWQPAGVTERDAHLLALATMVGGLRLSTFAELDLGELLPTTRPGPDRYDAQRIQAMNGRAAQELVRPLAPDLLAEYFVLQLLAPRDSLDDRGRRLWRTAGRLNPVNAFNFVEQCAIDHPGHPTLRTIGFPLLSSSAERLVSWTDFFFRNESLLDQFGVETVMDHLSELLTAARAHPEEADNSSILLLAVGDIVKGLGHLGELDAAQRMHESMLEWEAERPTEAAGAALADAAGEADQALGTDGAQKDHISRWWYAAERAYTLLTFHCFAGEVGRAMSFLPSLQGWAATELLDGEVQGYAAAGLANVVSVLAGVGDYTGAVAELQWLGEHLGRHPEIGLGNHLPLLRSPVHEADALDTQAAAPPNRPGEREGALDDPVAELLRGARSVAVSAIRAAADEASLQVLAILDGLRQQRAADARLTMGWRHLLWEMAVNHQHHQRTDVAVSLMQRWLASVAGEPVHTMAEFAIGLETAGRLAMALLESADEAQAEDRGAGRGGDPGTSVGTHAREQALQLLRASMAALAAFRFEPPSASASLGAALQLLGYSLYRLALRLLLGGPDEKAAPEALAELVDAASDALVALPALDAADAQNVHDVFGATHWARLAARREGPEGLDAWCGRFERALAHLRRQAGSATPPLPSGMVAWAFELLLAADEQGRADRVVGIVEASRDALFGDEVLAKLGEMYSGLGHDEVEALLTRLAPGH